MKFFRWMPAVGLVLLGLGACSVHEESLDPAQATRCPPAMEALSREVQALPPESRLAFLDERAPQECRSTDAYTAAESAALLDLGRTDDAKEIMSGIDLEATEVPLALEVAFLLSFEDGWPSPLAPERLASRYIELSPESPIGHVMLSRVLVSSGRDDEVLAEMAKASDRLRSENKAKFALHAADLIGFYGSRGDVLSAYRLAYEMFANLGDQAWTEEGPVAGSAHVAILVGRREEASRIMDEYFRRNPHVPLSDYRLRVLGELARPTLEPVTTLPQGEPTISHLLWPKESP